MNTKDICGIVADVTNVDPETVSDQTVIPEQLQGEVMEQVGAAVAANLSAHRKPGLTPAKIMRMLKDMLAPGGMTSSFEKEIFEFVALNSGVHAGQVNDNTPIDWKLYDQIMRHAQSIIQIACARSSDEIYASTTLGKIMEKIRNAIQ